MRTSVFLISILLITTLFYSCENKPSTAAVDDVVQNGIRWNGQDETANYLATSGMNHFVNIELENAYTVWSHAVKLDSSLFAPHTMLALMSRGAKRDYHTQMAKKFVVNENETSKLFVSLLDMPIDSTGREARRSAWAKMHELSNGPFIHLMFVRSMRLPGDAETMIAELDKLIAFAKENKMSAMISAANNQKGYALQRIGNLEAGTAAIEQSMEYYDGYNPLDSRAEFYLFARDTANAIATYKKVLEKYPFAQNAQEALNVLEPKK